MDFFSKYWQQMFVQKWSCRVEFNGVKKQKSNDIIHLIYIYTFMFLYIFFSHFWCKIFIYLHEIGTERKNRGSGGDHWSKVSSTCLSSLRNQGISEKSPYLILLQVWLKETYLPAYLRDFIIKQTQIKGSTLSKRSSREFSVDFKGVRHLSLHLLWLKSCNFLENTQNMHL